MYIYLNPQYVIRNEKHCSYIISKSALITTKLEYTMAFASVLPPSIGYILSHIGEGELNASIEKIANTLNVKSDIIEKFIRKIIDNPIKVGWNYKGVTISFPPYLLTSVKEESEGSVYTDDELFYTTDFIPKRPSIPLNLNFMITTKCGTDCMYCYADRNKRYDLTSRQIMKVIDEAHDIGVVNLALTGGDIFAFPDWKKLVRKVGLYGFKPLLSTKIPLKKDDVYFLKESGINFLQFSLDSVFPSTLQTIVHVKEDYIDNVRHMFEYCTDNGIKVTVRTVLTKYNSDSNEIDSLCAFLEGQLCVANWVLTPAFYSGYKNGYTDYRASDDALVHVYKMTKIKSSSVGFNILYNKMSDERYNLHSYKTVDEFVAENQICNANSYSMSILADGNTTACEMLYDNPHFIFGNVRQHTLRDLWNSDVALKMYSYTQQMIKRKENNACTKCKVYADCKLGVGKKVCYVDIAKVYGADRYEYPDPRCPQALRCEENLIL